MKKESLRDFSARIVEDELMDHDFILERIIRSSVKEALNDQELNSELINKLKASFQDEIRSQLSSLTYNNPDLRQAIKNNLMESKRSTINEFIEKLAKGAE